MPEMWDDTWDEDDPRKARRAERRARIEWTLQSAERDGWQVIARAAHFGRKFVATLYDACQVALGKLEGFAGKQMNTHPPAHVT